MIKVEHLTKKYGDHVAVEDLSFTIEDGQIYGFLGANGAGKSTTMNIMTGCLAATSGDVTVNGHNIFDEPLEAKKHIGYLPELPPLYPEDTPREYLSFVASAKGIPAKAIAQSVDSVMADTGLTDVADRLCKNLSKGYRQRVGIAQALLGSPDIVILDEPTVGLDPRQIIEIRDLIRSLGKSHTVILSSHILSEVQAVCTTILIISKGRLVACDTPEGLEKLFAGSAVVKLVLECDEKNAGSVLAFVGGKCSSIEKGSLPGTCIVSLECATSDTSSLCRDVFFACAKAGVAILEMTSQKASLEDIYIELTEHGASAAANASAGEEELSQQPADLVSNKDEGGNK